MMRRRRGLPAPLVLATAFVAGAVPFDNVAARLFAGTDLRRIGSGTVSGSSLYQVAGFGPLAIAGCCDLGKGAIGPLLAGKERPLLGALSCGASVVGHDWSPFLRGAGGRGIAPSLGAMLVMAPEGVVILGTALGVGRLVRHTALSSFLGAITLFPVLARRGKPGTVLASAVVFPMLTKRLFGNDGRLPRDGRRFWSRLLFDREQP